MAINLLGLPRATEDLDIFVAPEPDNIERLKKALPSCAKPTILGASSLPIPDEAQGSDRSPWLSDTLRCGII